jgi:tRNA (pseudouridine54-N1)-methyltransferase
MRTFILYSRKARTDNRFKIDDLLDSGGRMDVVCSCITSALWLSHKAREDTNFILVMNGPPNPPVTIWFDGSKLIKVYVDEKTNARWIKKLLSFKFGKEWKEISGTKISRKSFQEVLKELDGKVYVLHEKGTPIKDIEIEENPIFICGDNIGIPRAEEKFLINRGAQKVSLGKKVYLASSCISTLNWICDQRGI